MKITVLSGSPKGEESITLQYINFMIQKFPKHEFKVHHIGRKINSIVNDDSVFTQIIDDVSSSNAVIWATPVFIFLVPAQYKLFIELISKKNVRHAFHGKYTVVLTTSLRFFDHTAHNYMRSICEDLEMKYVDFYSADSFDLMKESGPEKLTKFTESFIEAIKKNAPTSRIFPRIVKSDIKYTPGISSGPMIDSSGKKILLVSDRHYEPDSNMHNMIDRFKKSFNQEIETAVIDDIKISGACLGCVMCGYDNTCVYTGKDDFIHFYDSKIKGSDILIYCGEIVDRFLSYSWKRFFDRRFYNTHQPTLGGKQIGFIISGPLKQNFNLRQGLEAMIEWERGHLVEMVSDETTDSADLDSQLQNLADRLVWYSKKDYVRPVTFLSTGGMKIFRDDVWGRLRFVFQEDYKYYEANGIFDFPQNDVESINLNDQMTGMMENPFVRKRAIAKISEQFKLVMPGR